MAASQRGQRAWIAPTKCAPCLPLHNTGSHRHGDVSEVFPHEQSSGCWSLWPPGSQCSFQGGGQVRGVTKEYVVVITANRDGINGADGLL